MTSLLRSVRDERGSVGIGVMIVILSLLGPTLWGASRVTSGLVGQRRAQAVADLTVLAGTDGGGEAAAAVAAANRATLDGMEGDPATAVEVRISLTDNSGMTFTASAVARHEPIGDPGTGRDP